MEINNCGALLLVGPTGSGKTPLGDICEEKGLGEGRCTHFDFGENLRKIARTGEGPASLTEEEKKTISWSLKTGALLENKYFHIARKILLNFARQAQLVEPDLILLNGLPRHVGQARDIDAIIEIKKVVYLECSPLVARERIRLNSGGDREGRKDDSLEAIQKKLELFHSRTLPLLEHYRNKHVDIEKINVQVETKPLQLHQWLDASGW